MVPSGSLVLILGGTRSGKSAVAERLATQAGGPVTYLATGPTGGEGMEARIAAHRARRPADWTTVECGAGLAEALRDVPTAATVLIDSLGTWLAGHHDFVTDDSSLLAALSARTGSTIVVSEEVGLSLHAPTEVGRLFVDALGELNQAVAAIADRVGLVVAGRTLWLPADDTEPGPAGSERPS